MTTKKRALIGACITLVAACTYQLGHFEIYEDTNRTFGTDVPTPQ